MPEEHKPSEGAVEVTAENGTGTTSPDKSPINRGKIAVAKVTLLDGTVKDFPIEVRKKS